MRSWSMAASLAFVFVHTGCLDAPSAPRPAPEPTPDFAQALGGFETEAAFEQYMAAFEDNRHSGTDDFGGNNATDADSGSEPENENITNNQEEGVDEGGIVKNVGDFLLVLRKGRLFTVAVAESGATQLASSIRVASDEDLNQNVWYDEMLVDGDDVYVIGYRYLTEVVNSAGQRLDHIWGATEINTFAVNADGSLVRRGSSFIESNDYYSWDNSATRMVDGRIIYYMPFGAFFSDGDRRKTRFPKVLRHVGDGRFETTKDLFGYKDVVRPVERPEYPTFHTVVSCDVSDDTLDCGARTLVGDWWREVYVSRDNVFLWSGDRVYAMSQMSLDVATHAVRGFPPSRFAFKQDADVLHVGVQTYPEDPDSDEPVRVEMLSLPLADFDDLGEQHLRGKATTLKELESGAGMWKNRHVDGWWLTSLDQWGAQSSEHMILAHRVGTDIVNELPIDNASWSGRIEAMPGIGALFVEPADTNLRLHTIHLRQDRAEFGRTVEELADVREGESRSHGFFFKRNEDGGTFGLPIINGGVGNGWGFGVSNIAFFDASSSGVVEMVGTVSSSPASEGGCETSCIDWYGNTRPIFLRDRIYALMGSEVQEVQVSTAGVVEVGSRVELKF